MGTDSTPGASRAVVFIGRFAELEDALVERVREVRAGRPLAPVTIVVGSAAVRTRVGDLLVRRLGAAANVDVLTLSRLAAELLAGAGQGSLPVLAGVARERLVRRLVEARATGLAYFGRVADRPHFAAALAATFADLREARIASRPGWAAAAVAAGGEGSRDKAADLEQLYDAYCEELERSGLADRAALYLAAAGAVDSAPPRSVLLYGLYDFNQAQEALVAALAGRGADLFVPAPRGGVGDEAAPALAVAAAAGLEARRLDPPAPGDDVGRLAPLWGTVPAKEPLRLTGDGSLRVVSVADERAEAREAVRLVVRAAAEGASFHECAVVAPHGDDVERLAVALEAAGVPVACRRPERTPGSRIVARLVDCLAPPAGPPMARRTVIELLRAAPLVPPCPAVSEAALWLDEARQAGVIGGAAQWAERLGRHRRGLEGRLAGLEGSAAPEADVDEDDAQTVARVRARVAATRSLEHAAASLTVACAGLPVRAAWGEWAAGLTAVAETLFAESAAGSARDVLDRLRALDILGEHVGLADVAAVVRDQSTAATVPAGRVGRRGVAVLTPLELRGLRFDTVVITGLAEGGFPARGRPDPVLGDRERGRLNERLGARLPLAEARDAESTLLFALACEAARLRVALLAPRTDAATGRPRLPSRLLLRLAALARGGAVGLDDFLDGRPLAPVWSAVGGSPAYRDDAGVVWVDARERDTAVLLALSGGPRAASAREYLAVVAGSRAERRLSAWRAGRAPEPGPWDGLLGAAALAALSDRHPFAAEMHPTRLERFLGCPFAFLLRDVLGLDAPDEPDEGLDMEAREFGSLVHDILQRTYREVIARGLGGREALAAVDAAWREGCAAAERRGVTGAAFAWAVRREVLLDDLRECVGRDPVFDGDGRPGAVEWQFGEAAGRPVSIALGDGRRVRFAGRLDRIDETPRGARVIDYKTGRGGTERQRIKAGTSVQLPVYQAAARQAYAVPPGPVVSLYRLVTRRGGFEELPLPHDEATAAERLVRLVEATVRLIDGGVFARSTAGRCEYCDVQYACGLTGWARARKREHPALQALVALQTRGPAETEGGADA